jgi:uncharacterized protein
MLMKKSPIRVVIFAVIAIVMSLYVISMFYSELSSEFDNGNSSAGDNTQLANPSATFCIEQGGEYDIRDEEAGQKGYCLIDEQECSAWEYFRGECEFSE